MNLSSSYALLVTIIIKLDLLKKLVIIKTKYKQLNKENTYGYARTI